MKKAGKDVEESSDIDITEEEDEKDQVPVVDNSGSIGDSQFDAEGTQSAIASSGKQKIGAGLN